MVYDRRRSKVMINDREYTIVGEKSTTHVNLVAETVNKQLDDLKAMSSALSKEEQAILIAVNAVSDQIKLHEKMIKLEEKLENIQQQ